MQATLARFPESGRSPGEDMGYPLQCSWASLVAQSVESLLARRETWVQSMGWEDPLEKSVTIYFSILAWRIPMDRGARVHWVAKSWTRLSD